MARKKYRGKDEIGEPDLLPILNLVLILIPLLLLGLIFVEIAVIEISMAQKSRSAVNDPNVIPPPKLIIMVNEEGFTVLTNDTPIGPIEGCPGPVTICLDQNKASDPEKINRYNWMQLYNVLARLKQGKDPLKGTGSITLDFSEVDQFDLIADEKTTFDILVKTMDIARHQRMPKNKVSKEAVATPEIEINFSDHKVFLESKAPKVIRKNKEGKDVKGLASLFRGVVLGMPSRRN